MSLNHWLLRSGIGLFALAALLALPAVHAADGKKRVYVQYPSKAVSKKTLHKTLRKYPAFVREPIAVTANGMLGVKSASVLVVDFNDGHTIYGKNTQSITPIASITKLMTAMVVLDANLPLDETIYIDSADLDLLKRTRSRLAIGTALTRREMLRLALMSSENRAASALGRAYPGGAQSFIAAMNRKAVELGMWNTHFVDANGLASENVSTAEDLVKMVKSAYDYALIREFTTTTAHEIATDSGRNIQFRNSNGLVKSSAWEIGLSKTGYISEAGRCLVMQARIAARPVVIVLLDSLGKYTRLADANRIKKWLESRSARKPIG